MFQNLAKRVSKLITRGNVSKTSLDNEHDIVISDTDKEPTTDTDEESPSDTDEGSPSDTGKKSITNADKKPMIDISKMYKSLEMECKNYVKSKEYVYKSVIHNDVPYIVVLKRIPKLTHTTESRLSGCLLIHENAPYRGSVFSTADIISIIYPHDRLESIVNKRQKIYTLYKVGQNVYPDKYDERIAEIKTHGIHFYKKLNCAFHHDIQPAKNGYVENT